MREPDQQATSATTISRAFSFCQSSDPFAQSLGVIGSEGVQSSVPGNM